MINGFFVGTVLATDPPEHGKLRAVLSEQLAPRAMQGIETDIETKVDDLVRQFVQCGQFAAVSDLATLLPLSVVSELIGLPEHVRDDLPRWADSTFTVFGPMNQRAQEGLAVMRDMYDGLGTLRRGDLKPGSMGRAIFDAAEAGRIRHESCGPLLSAYTTAGIDTTVSAIANAVHLFATHPDQWTALRTNPDAIPSAFNEVLRYDPRQAFARQLTREVTIDNIRIPSGARIVLLYGSGNRDERHYPEPNRFDISRDSADQLVFGHGRHSCAGQALAEIEGHAILKALARRVRRIHIGEPKRRLNNVVRDLEALPVTRLDTDNDA